MKSTKDIFMTAAKAGKAVHIGVHLESFMYSGVRGNRDGERAFRQTSLLGDILKGKVTSLWTTIGSKLHGTINPTDTDIVVEMSRNTSAIEDEKHQTFLNENKTSVALISGLSKHSCVKDTKTACENKGITPILVVDAIDFSTPAKGTEEKNAESMVKDLKDLFGESCLYATTAQLQEWTTELNM